MKLFFKLVLIFPGLLYNLSAVSQGSGLPAVVGEQFDWLEYRYHEGNLSKSGYLQAADSLIIHFFTTGTYFESGELAELLTLFRDIAWSEEGFKTNRINYFEHFLNNALMQNKGGEAIYFSEKVSREITGTSDEKSLVELYTKCIFYIRNKNYEKARDLYKEETGNIGDYPARLKSGELSDDEGLKMLHLLSIIITPFTELNDTTWVDHTVETAESLADELLLLTKEDKGKSAMSTILVSSMRYFRYMFMKDYPKAEGVLLEVQNLLDKEKDLPVHISTAAEYNLLEWWILYYLDTKNNIKANAYIERYAGMPSISGDHSNMINKFRSRLKANEGNFVEAYNILEEAGKAQEKLYANMMNELDDLLYSHTASEISSLALERSEAEKAAQAFWFRIMVAVAVIILLIVYLWVQRQREKNRAIIESLNNEANFQIALLEEEKRQAGRKEQERIGLELHDDLSASMAAMLYRMEYIVSSVNAPDTAGELTEVKEIMQKVYNSVRAKSHTWQEGSVETDGAHFRDQVEKLATALPDKRYTKEIEIDDAAVRRLSPDSRVELLRIIQESVVNILKHARASVVSIFVFKKGDEVVLHVSDNGKGFDQEKVRNKSGLGLKSLKQRAGKLNGKLTISSDREGTSIEVVLGEGSGKRVS